MLDSAESVRTASFGAMARKTSKGTKPERREELPGQVERLKRLRRAFGFESSKAFSVFLEIEYVRWNAIENGAPLSRDVAFRLVRKISGLSLDWLYFAKTEALPLELARRLGELGSPPGKRNTE